jgi:hypothetical protein
MLLEVFLHRDCLSTSAVLDLCMGLRRIFQHLRVRLLSGTGPQARERGISVSPAFLLDGRLLAVGVPRKEWLAEKVLRESRDQPL